jgi:RNA polymerase sigma-70 factor (ECF subfamily)
MSLLRSLGNAQTQEKGATAIDSTHLSLYPEILSPKSTVPDRVPQAKAAPAVTVLLRAWAHGDEAAGERLFPIIYSELRRQAARYMRRERRCHTLQPSGLVNEAYMRLAASPDLDWHDRDHFFAIAARIMRRVLVDHARRRRAAKRAGCHVTFDDADAPAAPPDLLDLENALESLAALDPRQARVVELRFFGGLDVEKTAAVMGLSARTVKREWQTARAWLQHRLLHGGKERP